MKIINKRIKDIVNEEIKNYALYTIYNRAIPNLIDGFKPTQRKLFYVMRNFYKNKSLIVSSLAGAIREKANYHHGNDSAEKTIVVMTRDYPTSNQIPIFIGKGEFGSRLFPDGYAAPRYISVKYNPIMDYIFRPEDEPILPRNLDLENPEPEFYIPIIPMVLINGASGIATGFATRIYQRNIYDIINWIKNYLMNNDFNLSDRMYPFFKNTDIEVLKEENKYVSIGKIKFYKDRNFKKESDEETKFVKIYELPPKYNRDLIIKILNKLKDKKVINKYKDLSKDKFDINIELSSKDKLLNHIYQIIKEELNEIFILIEPELTEELEVSGLKIKEYDIENFPEISLMKDFVNIRLKFYEKRIKFIKNKLFKEINFLKKKLVFIKEIENLKGKNKEEIFKILNEKYNNKFTQNDISRLLNISFISLTKENIKQTKEKINELKEELKYFENITPQQLYIKELNELIEKLK